ncbi:MAG: PAS domain-containing protein [bacterium]|nr:PAS domain-containing protein [bacterium]
MYKTSFSFYFYIYFFIFFTLPLSKEVNGQISKNEIGSPFIRNYTPSEYQAYPQNWIVIQDKRGVIYAGNTYGVLEFDGKNWRLIKVSNNSMVRALAMDSKGTIYVGGVGEFGFLASDDSGNTIYVSLLNRLKDKKLLFNDVRVINVTSEGVYFVTNNHVFQWNDVELKVIPVSFVKYSYTAFERVFIVQRDRGLYIINDGKLSLLPHCDIFTRELHGRIVILPYDSSRLLIVTSKKGFFLYDFQMLLNTSKYSDGISDQNVPQSVLSKFSTEIEDYIIQNDVYYGIRINNNHYAFATLGGGIVIMDRNGSLVQVINSNRGLQSNVVHYIYRDNHHNLWASLQTGISHIEINSPITQFNKTNGLEEGAMAFIRHDDRVYVGAPNGVYYLPQYRLQIENDVNNLLPVNNARDYCLGFVSHKNILLAAGTGVHYIHDYEGKKLNDSAYIMSFGRSKKFPNTVFIGMDSGFSHLDIKEKNSDPIFGSRASYEIGNNIVLEIYNNIFGELEKDQIVEIVSDKSGDLWLASTKDVIHIKFNSQDVSDAQISRYNESHGLPQMDWSSKVHYIDNELIVTTPKGIYTAIVSTETDTDTESIKFMPEKTFGDEFADKSIGVDKIYDDKDNIWISTKLGLGISKKDQNGSYKRNTIPFKKIQDTILSFAVEQDGIAWISSSEALYRYDPSIVKEYESEYIALIRKVTVNNDIVIFNGNHYNPLTKKGEYFTEILVKQPPQSLKTFDYRYNSIAFEYSAAFYEHTKDIKFQYKLEGYDKEWSSWTYKYEKEYTNLPEGSYKFKIKAKNIFEHKSGEAVYAFNILPPWYRTVWAYTSYAILTILLFIIGIRINTRLLIAAKRRLEKIVKERTKVVVRQAEELKQKNLELEKLSIVASETDNAVIIMDAEGNIEWVNEAFVRFYKMNLEEFVEEKGKNIKEASANPKITTAINECISQNLPVSYESYVKMKKGENIWAHTTLTPMIDKDGKLIKLIAIDSDITELKKAEQKAISNAHKAGMADVAINTIHNVGNILNSVTTSISILPTRMMKNSLNGIEMANSLLKQNMDTIEDFICNDPKGKKLMKFYLDIEEKMKSEKAEMKQSIERVETRVKAINDVITAQRGYTENVKYLNEEVDLVEIVEDAIKMNSDFIEKSNIEVEREMADIRLVTVQKMKMIQILMNLIINAKEAMEETPDDNKLIKFILKEQGVAVQLKITDTGCGIPLEKMESIFSYGFTTKKGHSGFGLHNSANHMTEMGGKMWAENNSEGQGATFILEFRESQKG